MPGIPVLYKWKRIKRTRESSRLDHIYVKNMKNFDFLLGIVCETIITDHDPTLFGTNLVCSKPPRPDRFTVKIDFEAIRTKLAESDWSVVYSSIVNFGVEVFTNQLSEITSKYSKYTRTSRTKYNLKP